MKDDATRARRAIDAMNASLRARYQTLRELLDASGGESIEVRHRIGRVVMQITNDTDEYGTRALALLASALSRDATSLYRYGHVASRWSEDEIARVVERRNRAGARISWSHLVELSTVAGRKEREELLERTFAEALSVRDLVRVVRSREKARRARAAPAIAIERWIDEVAQMSRRLADASSDYERVSQITSERSGRQRKADLVGRARKAHEQLGKENTIVLRCLVALERALRKGV
jgi:hypothetical protein